GSQHQNRKTGIYRAAARGESTFVRERAEGVARELDSGEIRPEHGYGRVQQTRREVERGWIALAEEMEQQGQHDVAARFKGFVDRMPPLRTDRQLIAERIRATARERAPATR